MLSKIQQKIKNKLDEEGVKNFTIENIKQAFKYTVAPKACLQIALKMLESGLLK